MTRSCGASHPCAGSPIEQRSSPMPPVRIGLITTLNRNIGDDFIRDGIVQLMLQVFAGRDVRFVTVNKHTPWSVYPGWHPLRWLQTLEDVPRGRRAADWMRTSEWSPASFGGEPLRSRGHRRSVWGANGPRTADRGRVVVIRISARRTLKEDSATSLEICCRACISIGKRCLDPGSHAPPWSRDHPCPNAC